MHESLLATRQLPAPSMGEARVTQQRQQSQLLVTALRQIAGGHTVYIESWRSTLASPYNWQLSKNVKDSNQGTTVIVGNTEGF